MRTRSLYRSRCGEVYSPTLYPAASRTDSSMAQVDPLPLVPATVMMVASSSSARRRFTAVTRSSPSSMLVGWMRSMYASHSESVLAAMRVRDRMTLFERVILSRAAAKSHPDRSLRSNAGWDSSARGLRMTWSLDQDASAGRRRKPQQKGEQRGQFVAHLAPVHD